MRYILFFPLILSTLSAQETSFQQEVKYTIQVLLDDTAHTLEGQVDIQYTNNAPSSLDTLYFHLWANAFRDQTSAYAHEQRRMGKGRYYFSQPHEKGYYEGLDFQVDGQKVEWQFDQRHPDIAYLLLPSPLEPGSELSIQTPFKLKIPYAFSRLGHVGQSYQMTQWFPKVAVYDQDGWHPLPYLDQGEFYGNFGTYNVAITLPENYVVAATGTLQTESEIEWLRQRSEKTAQKVRDSKLFLLDSAFFRTPASSKSLKTLHFTAERVHDFAWFADKRFLVQQDSLVLENGQAVKLSAFFLPQGAAIWDRALFYLRKSLLFFSEKIGEYPYPQLKAVQGPLEAGLGMEYPMITIIGEDLSPTLLETTIAHEVAHNWWYGVIGFNERRHPWLDEGLTSFYEQKYVEENYNIRAEALFPRILQGDSEMTARETLFLYLARQDKDQAAALPSRQFNELNYYLALYEKTPMTFQLLEAYLREDLFEKIIQTFYQKWAFRHPGPQDLQKTMEEVGQKDLDWFFDGLIGSDKKIDYAITRVERSDSLFLHLKNKGEIDAPFFIGANKMEESINGRWVEGFYGKKVVSFPVADYEKIVIDPDRRLLDINRKNNSVFPGRIFPKKGPLKISPLPQIEDDKRTQLFLSPLYGWNQYDGHQPGLALYNQTFPAKKLEYQLAPLWGTKSGNLGGLACLTYHIRPRTKVKDIALGMDYKGFSFFENEALDYRLGYRRWMPSAKMEIIPDLSTGLTHRLQWRSIYLEQEEAIFMDGIFFEKKWTSNWIHELSYELSNEQQLHPFTLSLALEQQSYRLFGQMENAVKASFTFNKQWAYQENRAVDLRFFFGMFLQNTRRKAGLILPNAFNLISQGYNDYRYDELYFGRNENDGILSQQISERDGGFKTPIGAGFPLGRSNNLIVSLNLKADLPFSSIFRPFLDIGYFDNTLPGGQNASFNDQLLYSGGLAVELWETRLGIYLPFFNSQNLGDRLSERGSYLNRIGIKVDLNRMHPVEQFYDLESF